MRSSFIIQFVIFLYLSTLEETWFYFGGDGIFKAGSRYKVGGVPEVIDDKIDGFLIDPFDSEQAKEKFAFYSKIKIYQHNLESEEWKKLRKNLIANNGRINH